MDTKRRCGALFILTLLVIVSVWIFPREQSASLAWAQHNTQKSINALRIGKHKGFSRFVIDLDHAPSYRLFTLNNPARLVIDLPEVSWQRLGRSGSSSIIREVRYGLFQPGNSRIVLDLAKPAEIIRVFTLGPDRGRPWRIIVDLRPVSQARFDRNIGRILAQAGDVVDNLSTSSSLSSLGAQSSIPSSQGQARQRVDYPRQPLPRPDMSWNRANVYNTSNISNPSVKQPSISLQQRPSSSPDSVKPWEGRVSTRKAVIVIDPGHGGIDPGAVGPDRTKEKTIVLAIARQLADHLEEKGSYHVRLTRDHDRFISLRDRKMIARESKADLFISLHADSIRESSARGVSVYVLSEKASDREAALLAARENKADLIGGADLSETDRNTRQILIDLAQRESMVKANYFRDLLIDQFEGRIPLLSRPKRSAGFVVLKAPEIPSVLVEVGFLSNKRDARQLKSRHYHRKIAHLIAEAIHNFAHQTLLARRDR